MKKNIVILLAVILLWYLICYKVPGNDNLYTTTLSIFSIVIILGTFYIISVKKARDWTSKNESLVQIGLVAVTILISVTFAVISKIEARNNTLKQILITNTINIRVLNSIIELPPDKMPLTELLVQAYEDKLPEFINISDDCTGSYRETLLNSRTINQRIISIRNKHQEGNIFTSQEELQIDKFLFDKSLKLIREHASSTKKLIEDMSTNCGISTN